MNLRFSLLSLSVGLCSLCALATAQQLTPDHYLVGTQGWLNNNPANVLNTIQLVSPYTGKATVLKVTGLPVGEAPASFVIQSPTSFLVGTKTLQVAVPAAGNIYKVQLQKNNTWIAKRLNTKALGINVSDMVVSGAYAYVIGSAIFSNTGDDAQILKIALSNGAVSVHIQLGRRFRVNSPIGAMGLGSSLVLVGGTLHAFTFDTTTETPQYSEHWVVTIARPVQMTQLPSLPSSKRRVVLGKGAGFGTSGAFIDPKNNQRLIVVGRWGELIWRDFNGKDLKYQAFPGPVNFNNATWKDELWRGVALNTNTHAFGMGDHNGASIDERRIANSPGAKESFSNNIAKAIRPPMNLIPKDVVVFTVAGMAYVSGTGSYRTIGTGCPDGKLNGIPTSYATGAPARGNSSFGLSLHARPKGIRAPTAAILMVSGRSGKLGLAPLGAPGCSLHIGLGSLGIFAPVGSPSNEVSIKGLRLPNQKLTVYTQWALSAPTTNRLGIVFSDARALIL